VPVLPAPPPLPPLPFVPPPQETSPVDINRSRNPISAPLSFLFRGLTKSNTNAKVAPLAEGQKRLLFRFSALDAAVVLTVSDEVCASAPLIVTEVGFRLQVGMSLTLVSVVVTLQVRFATPLNPLIPTTLIVPVLPVVVPGVTVKDVIPPDPGATPGSVVMLRSTVVAAFSEPEVGCRLRRPRRNRPPRPSPTCRRH
jgi:hypothetical protein